MPLCDLDMYEIFVFALLQFVESQINLILCECVCCMDNSCCICSVVSLCLYNQVLI